MRTSQLFNRLQDILPPSRNVTDSDFVHRGEVVELGGSALSLVVDPGLSLLSLEDG